MTAPARDPGLQPERTALAWRRTLLAFAVGGLIAMRVLSETLGGAAVVVGLGGVVAAAALLVALRRRRRSSAVAGGLLLAATAGVCAAGALLGLLDLAITLRG